MAATSWVPTRVYLLPLLIILQSIVIFLFDRAAIHDLNHFRHATIHDWDRFEQVGATPGNNQSEEVGVLRLREGPRELLCGGCWFHEFQPRKDKDWTVTCGMLIDFERNKLYSNIAKTQGVNNDTLNIEAARSVAVNPLFMGECSKCHPESCSDDDKVYPPYDVAAPRIKRAYTLPFLSSVPADMRLPSEAVHEPFSYPGFWYPDKVQRKTFVFDMNPSIVRLHDDQIPDYLNERPAYLCSLRQTSIVPLYLFGGNSSDLLKWTTGAANFLGLAFLRNDFSVIADGTFLLPDLEDVLVNGKEGFDIGQPAGWDFRLYNLYNQLYITYRERIVPIWLTPGRKDPEGVQVMTDHFRADSPFKVSVSLMPSCCASDQCFGKNFVYFEGPSSSEDDIWVNSRPVFPHVVEKIHITKPCSGEALRRNTTHLENLYVDDRRVYPSFSTVEESLALSAASELPRWSRHRGTSCCVSIQHPNSEEPLLVGISHRVVDRSKSGPPFFDQSDVGERMYVSNFYAFRAEPPFDVVAFSGQFCLGYSAPGPELEANHLTILTHLVPLRMGKEVDCPSISFASGFTESATDPERVVVAYGLNDMLSRIIEFDKSEVVRMLFDPFESRADDV